MCVVCVCTVLKLYCNNVEVDGGRLQYSNFVSDCSLQCAI